MVPERKSDRRVAYTKRVLREALVKLLRNQHISDITITSICESADINRSTFYLHYRDQYDLLHKIEEEVLHDVCERLTIAQESINEKDAWTPVTQEMILSILIYAKENYDLAMALFSNNCDFSFQQDIVDLVKRIVPFPKAPIDQRLVDIIMTHAVNGAIELLVRWLHEGATEDPNTIADLLLKLVYSGTTSFNPEDNFIY